jgi:hypothetical protein
MTKNSKNFTISISHHICPIFHAENDLSKLKFNFAHFIGPILTLRGPTPLCQCSALRAFEQGGIFIVPILMWHWISVYIRGPCKPDFFTADCSVDLSWTHWHYCLRIVPLPDHDTLTLTAVWPQRVWPVSRGYLLLHGTWSYLRICQRSVLPYTRFGICLLDYNYVWHINFAILYFSGLIWRTAPISLPLTTRKGVLRTYSYPDPYGSPLSSLLVEILFLPGSSYVKLVMKYILLISVTVGKWWGCFFINP